MAFSGSSTALKESVVIVGSEKNRSRSSETFLRASGITIKVIDEARSPLEMISPQWNGVLVICSDHPAVEGWGLLEKTKQLDPDLPVVMIIGPGDVSPVVKAMRMGAYDVLQKPVSNQDLHKIILGALETRRENMEKRSPQIKTRAKKQSEVFIQGGSRCMGLLSETIRKAGEVDAGVVLMGEMGTGKKMIAQSLHEHSRRKHKNFISVNCSSIPEDVLEKDLFGQEPGTFVGTPGQQAGKLECADGGTVYLEKIDSLSIRLQDRLLHVLQEGAIERLGSNEPRPLDIRVIASTKKNLKNACDEGKFREALFYRINIIQIAIPPLRDHAEDVSKLFQHFAQVACKKYHLPTPLITPEIWPHLMTRDWPGNIRELKNVAERFALGFGIDLPDPVNQEESIHQDKLTAPGQKTLVEKIDAFEKNLIVQELARTHGSVKTTYTTLGLPRKTFYDKMNKHGLKRKDFLASEEFPENLFTLPK